MEQRASEQPRSGPPLQFSCSIPDSSLQPPVFRLAGLAIGDGLTDPLTQVLLTCDAQEASRHMCRQLMRTDPVPSSCRRTGTGSLVACPDCAGADAR